jgi:hypothetical protein
LILILVFFSDEIFDLTNSASVSVSFNFNFISFRVIFNEILCEKVEMRKSLTNIAKVKNGNEQVNAQVT